MAAEQYHALGLNKISKKFWCDKTSCKVPIREESQNISQMKPRLKLIWRTASMKCIWNCFPLLTYLRRVYLSQIYDCKYLPKFLEGCFNLNFIIASLSRQGYIQHTTMFLTAVKADFHDSKRRDLISQDATIRQVGSSSLHIYHQHSQHL